MGIGLPNKSIFYLSGSFLLILIFVCIFYWLHNNYRNRFNIITYFFLSFFKFFGLIYPFFLVANSESFLELMIVVILMFPALRTLEHSRKSKYELQLVKKIITDVDRFRVIYYFSNSILFFSYYYLMGSFILVAIVSLYYFVVRLFAFLYAKKFRLLFPK